MSIDRIDMEDITARIDELRGERDDLQQAIDDADGDCTLETDALMDWNTENLSELQELEALVEELRGAGGGDHQWHGDWYPRELIAEHDFAEYAEELASDCYEIPDTWPHRCIDWAKAARELSQDYSMVSFRGTSYYWR